jgi:putative restriction endonuclease
VAYWWVNQKQTWRHEIYDGYLWSPKLQANGRHLMHYDWMQTLHPGDIVLSYISGAFRFAGIVHAHARSERRPDFGLTSAPWSQDGWIVPTNFVDIQPVNPKDHLDAYRRVAPARYGPINSADNVVPQYLFALPDSLGELYLRAGGLTVMSLSHQVEVDNPSLEDDIVFTDEAPSHSLTETERLVLARARRGQGYFKEAVRRYEPACRLTGLEDPRHLVASHMKPWSESNNVERLDGHNGLLLSPHVDHLFDRGVITFEATSGRVRTSPRLALEVIDRWKLDLATPRRRFSTAQRPFLEYHQDIVFQAAAH